MNYKLVIFDLDGTILDTLEDLTASLNYALENAKFPPKNREEVRRIVGHGIRNMIERAVPDCTDEKAVEQTLSTFKAHYKTHCSDRTKPYSGIPQLLLALKEKGCLTAVVSNKADFAVQSLCNKHFPDMLDAVAGEKEGIRKKPAPDAVYAVMDKLGISRADAVYIGDSEVDVETAKNAGLDCISVDWGFRSRDELIAAGAKKIVSQPADILSL